MAEKRKSHWSREQAQVSEKRPHSLSPEQDTRSVSLATTSKT